MIYEIKNNFIKVSIKSFGAELNSLQKIDDNTEYVWQGDKKYWSRHSPILFPIVGRLKDDSYFYNNQKYSMAQHGFARDNDFKVIKNESDFIEFKLTETQESLKIYPFLFDLHISYKLENSKLIISYKIINKNETKMFFSIGAHPAFNCKLEDYFLEFEDIENTKRYFLDDKGLVYKDEILNFQNNKLFLDEKLFKDDALVFNDSRIKQLILKNSKNKRFIKVTFENFPYLGIWSKPSGAPFLCIEPWFGIADFRNSTQKLEDKKGILSIEKNEVFSSSYSIEI